MGRARSYGCPTGCNPNKSCQDVPGDPNDRLYRLECSPGCVFDMFIHFNNEAFLAVSDVPGSSCPSRSNPPFELRCDMVPTALVYNDLIAAYGTHVGYLAAQKVRSFSCCMCPNRTAKPS